MRALDKLNARWKAHQDRRYMKRIEREARRDKPEGSVMNRAAIRAEIRSTRGRGRARGTLFRGRRRVGSRGGNPAMRLMRKRTMLRRPLREREPNSNQEGMWEYR